MKPFWRNPPNSLVQARNIDVHPDYSFLQWLGISLLWILLLPLGALIYVVGRFVLGTLLISGQITFWLTERLLGRVKVVDALRWQGVRAYINNVVGTRLPHMNAAFRRFLFRLSGVVIGRGSFVGMGGYMEDYHPENVIIEDKVSCSFGVTFIAHGRKRNLSTEEKTIILRKGCYIGAGSIILPGVEIGAKAVVGAGSVVTKDVPPGKIVAGCPARVLGKPSTPRPAAPTSAEKGT